MNRLTLLIDICYDSIIKWGNMMTQNNNPTIAEAYTKMSKKKWLLIGLVILLICFISIQSQEKEEYRQNALLFQAYMQFTDPDYSRPVAFEIGHGFLSMEYGVRSDFGYVVARQSLFSDKISFKDKSPRQTFDIFGSRGLHPYDSSIVETLKNYEDVTIDITFSGVYPLEEIQALGLKYKSLILWFASLGDGLDLFGFPSSSEFGIREQLYTAASNQDHITGHKAFKQSVKAAIIQGIFVYGIRVTGTSDSLLSLLNDRPVKSVVVIKLKGLPFR
jgi:hypothetical protein